MKEKMIILSNAVVMTILGVRIDFYNRLLAALFRKKKMHFICRAIDSRLITLRKEFNMLEGIHLSAIRLDI